MKDEITQDSFVASTQNDCKLLSATGSVHWEWFYGWLQAFGGYFPKYATQEGENLDSDSCVRSFFATNVPYNLPTFGQDWSYEHFNMLDGDVFVFKPREWRGTNGGTFKAKQAYFLPFSKGFCFVVSRFLKNSLLVTRGRHMSM